MSRIYAGASITTLDFINPTSSSLAGPGTLCIAEHSENHGLISGPIDICELTPTSSTAPYMDVHTGNVLIPIYQCVNTLCTTLEVVDEVSGGAIMIYPNPAVEEAMVQLGILSEAVGMVVVRDQIGREVRRVGPPFPDQMFISCDEVPAGVYAVAFMDRNGRSLATMRLVFIED